MGNYKQVSSYDALRRAGGDAGPYGGSPDAPAPGTGKGTHGGSPDAPSPKTDKPKDYNPAAEGMAAAREDARNHRAAERYKEQGKTTEEIVAALVQEGVDKKTAQYWAKFVEDSKDEGRMTSQGYGHNVVKEETYKGRQIQVKATPPTRFGTLYYINNNPNQAWASAELALTEAKKEIDKEA